MNVKPINYNLIFEPDLEKFVFDGTETISASCMVRTDSITMHCADLKIKSCVVEHEGKTVNSTHATDDKQEELKITLDKKIKGSRNDIHKVSGDAKRPAPWLLSKPV